MLKTVLGALLLLTQLTAPSGSNGLPQVLTPSYKPTAAPVAGRKAEVVVSFALMKGYAINRQPAPPTIKVEAVPGLKFEKMDFVAPATDPKAKDEYYVDVPTVKVQFTAAKAGKYEIPAKLVYFFCSKADGFCARKVEDVKVPVIVQ